MLDQQSLNIDDLIRLYLRYNRIEWALVCRRPRESIFIQIACESDLRAAQKTLNSEECMQPFLHKAEIWHNGVREHNG